MPIVLKGEDTASDISFGSDDKVVHFVPWASKSAALSFLSSWCLIDEYKISIVWVIRDYGMVKKKKILEAPEAPAASWVEFASSILRSTSILIGLCGGS